MLATTLVTDDEIPADLAVEEVLATIVGLSTMGVESFNCAHTNRRYLPQPYRRGHDEDVCVEYLLEHLKPVVALNPSSAMSGLTPGAME